MADNNMHMREHIDSSIKEDYSHYHIDEDKHCRIAEEIQANSNINDARMLIWQNNVLTEPESANKYYFVEAKSLRIAEKDQAGSTMTNIQVPIWQRYVLTVTEAAEYYHIGETKLRRIAEEHPEADFAILNGNRLLFKREKFECFLDRVTTL